MFFHVKAISVSGITAAPKEYDGLTSATVSTSAAVFGGIVTGDAVTVSATGSFADKNAGTGKTVTLSSIYSGVDKDNYTISDQASTTADINKKALTITGITADNKVYNKTTVATINTTGAQFAGKVGSDDITVSATGSFADANVGDGKTVTLISTPAGTELGNYTVINQTSTTANITPKPLTITGVTVNPKEYDGTKTATVNTTNAQYGGIETGDTVNVSFAGGGEFATKDAGVAKAVTLLGSITGASAANYSLTGSLTADIARKAITVSGISAVNKDYDGTLAATVNASGAQFSGLIKNDIVSVTATGIFANKNAGTVIAVNLTSAYNGADAGNYTFTDQASAEADINKKALTITGTTAAGRVYDGGISASITAGTLSGFAPGETLTTTATGTLDSKNAGTRTATAVYTLADVVGAGGGLASNYSLADNTHSASISTKVLKVTGVTATNKTSDGNPIATMQAANALFDGLLKGDVVQVAALGTFDNSNPGQGKTVTYQLSGADLANYAAILEPVTADITSQPSNVVSALTATQTGITGTSDSVQVVSTTATNTVKPGAGTESLAQVPTRVLTIEPPVIKPINVPTQGSMNLSNASRSGAVQLVQSGAVTTLTFSNAASGLDRATVTTPALPVFNVVANKPVSETAVVVNSSSSAISVTTVANQQTGLTSASAVSSANNAGAGMATTTATLTMPDGSSATVTIGVTADGVLVIRVPAQSADADNSKAVSLIGMVTAKDAFGIAPESLKGVLIQAEGEK